MTQCYPSTFLVYCFTLLIFIANANPRSLNTIAFRSESSNKATQHEQLKGRTLRPARMTSDLRTRGIREMLRHDHELHYLDESRVGSASQFAARLRMTASRPALALEEIEDQLDGITCYDSYIVLGFIAAETLQLAYEEITKVDQFLIITSHEGCNHDGERDAHLVTEVSIYEDRFLVLAVTRVPWRKTFHSMTIDFGLDNADFQIRRHPDLRRRQDSEPSATTSDLSGIPSTVSFPVPPSSSPTPTEHDAHGHISFQFLDKSILPPELPGADGLTLHGPFIPHGFTVGCKNCTAQGSIDLIQGSFTVSNTNDTNDGDMLEDLEDIANFFENGYVELLVNDFSAHIELESTIQPSKSLTVFYAPLPEIGLPGFQIPGVGIIGPVFKPQIAIGTQVGAEFGFVYGFDLVVPNNSSIIIDIANVTNSSIAGFPGTTITAIPFQAELDSISLSVSAAFSPELLLGISLFDGKGEAGAGAFLDLPTIKATVSQVAHANSKCELVSNSTKTNDVIESLFDSLTKIVPEVDLDLGLVAQAGVHAGDFAVNGVKKYTALSTHYSLPTACLSFDGQAKTFGPAVAALASATGKQGTDKGGKNAAEGLVNPFTGLLGGHWRLQAVILTLAFMFGCFMGL